MNAKSLSVHDPGSPVLTTWLRLSIPGQKQRNLLLSREHKRKTPKGAFHLVAGPGIEPGSSGYEPDEVPLLYPAISV